MSNFFTHFQAIILLKLITAHLISDYFLQPLAWVKDKETKKIKSVKLLYHVIITFVTVWLFSRKFFISLFIGITHYGIDLWKIYNKDKSIKSFVLDQTLHLIVLIISWLYLINGFEQFAKIVFSSTNDFKILVLLTAYIFCTFPLGIIIGLATKRWRDEITITKEDSLDEAGKWIGIFERILILTFVINDHYDAIGFLIAAKALLRFKDSEYKLTEYVLIGTLISFTLTILLGIMIKMVL